MELTLRVLQLILKTINFFVNIPLSWRRSNPDPGRIPPIKNEILMLSLHEVLDRLQKKQITSVEMVSAYIDRVKEVNRHLNAIADHRFKGALSQAESVDLYLQGLIEPGEIEQMYQKFPLLGVPFTVKEACGVKNMKFVVGSNLRLEERCPVDCGVVKLLIDAGAIPILVSTNPEFCFSIETASFTNGVTLNPYDSGRTAGGSSGGEAALNAVGASLFGIGSDMDGSIRIPCLFNGVFGHKPTGGLAPITGHFPNCNDSSFDRILQLGPITRFAKDMPLILSVMVGKNNSQNLGLNENKKMDIKDIKIYYSYGFTGINALLHRTVHHDFKTAIDLAVQYFDQNGLRTERIDFEGFKDSLEISLSAIVSLENFPHIMNNTIREGLKEFIHSVYHTDYQHTKEALWFDLLHRCDGFIKEESRRKYKLKTIALKDKITQTLGNDGVFIFPTFPTTAFSHSKSLTLSLNIDYTMLFNALELPASQVTMGLTKKGLPYGFQVIAAPLKDVLCLQIAEELEKGFGGWVPPAELAN